MSGYVGSVIRVLHVAQPTSGGVAEVVVNLVADQVRQGWEVFAACPSQNTLAGRLFQAGADVRPWSATRSPGVAVVGEARRIARVVERVQPDLVHLHSAKAGLAGRLALRGRRPTIFQPHAWSFEAVGGLLHHSSLAWERYASRWTTRLLCVSEHEYDRGGRLGITVAADLVPNGIDLDRFRAYDDEDRRIARARLGLIEAPTIVCVGRLCQQKGQDLLIAAWPQVATAVPEARLVLVGDGPDAAALRAAAPPGVHFAGHADDPRPWYAAADVVVMPSRWEAMPLVLLEAMASRRCVIATDVGGVRGTLDDQDVIPLGKQAVLAGMLVVRLRDPAGRAARAEANRATVVERHDVRHTAHRVREVYAKALDEAVGSRPSGAVATGPDAR